MHETGYLRGRKERLYYDYCQRGDDVKGVIIFVHAASGNRLGPHRMFVEMGEKFYKLGYAVMRFDFAGCGDSTGNGGLQTIDDDSFDLWKVCEFVRKEKGIDRVFLIGISRGGRLGFNAARKYDMGVDGMVLLSASFLDGGVFLSLMARRLKEYLVKMKDPRTIKKLMCGAVNFKGVLRTFGFCFQFKQKNETDQGNGGFKSKCPMLFVYGGSDPVTEKSQVGYKQICEKNGIDNEFVVIEKANHSFFHYKWKQQLFAVFEKWFEKITEDQGLCQN